MNSAVPPPLSPELGMQLIDGLAAFLLAYLLILVGQAIWSQRPPVVRGDDGHWRAARSRRIRR